MDLLDDFDRARATFAELGAISERIDSGLADAMPAAVAVPGPTDYDLPCLSLEPTVRQAARGRGQVVAAAAAADCVLLATSRGFLLRYSWDDAGSERVQEVELTRQADVRVRSLHVHPSGTHAMVCLRSGGTHETHYLHSSWSKTRPLSRLRGCAITAVGWQRHAASGGDGTSPHSPAMLDGDDLTASTGELLLGTDGGALYSSLQQLHAKREGATSLLLDFRDARRCITDAAQEMLPGGRRAVFVATPGSLYVAVGGPGLVGALGRHSSSPSNWEPLLEVGTPSLHSQLRLLRSPGDSASAPPARLTWLVGGALLHCHLTLEAAAEDDSVTDGNALLGDVLQLALAGAGSGPEDEPHALAHTEHHYLLLYADRLAAVNQVSGRTVHELAWGPGNHVTGLLGTPQGLLQDPSSGAVQLWSGDALHEVTLSNEGRDMWRVYLEHQDFDNALKLASGPSQRDAVYQAMGDAAAAAGDYKAAAGHFARIIGGRPPFEELALQLVESGEPEALQAYLATKLTVLSSSDKAQSTMIASWLTELLLDQINRDLLAGGGQSTPAYEAHVAQLRSFLSDHAAVLSWGTTAALLESYGRLAELETFAAARGDQEALLSLLMRHPDQQGVQRALGVLRKPSVPPTLIYRFAPELLAAAPTATVDLLVGCGPRLDPRQLLPALVRFGQPGAPRTARAQALRYALYALDVLRCHDSAVANLAVALLSLEDDEAPLLDFLGRARSPLRRPLYDPHYALRLARERGRRQSCVSLLVELGLHADAVNLALTAGDLALAKAVAGSPEDDEGGALRRKLWLSIAKHVVQGGSGGGDSGDQAARIKTAVDLLGEAGGLLHIEDVLPFFPDFVAIDNFKGAITDSLARYNTQIEELKAEMDEATAIAEAVRRDLKQLSNRAAVISARQLCAACGRGVLDPPPNPLGLSSGGAVPPFYLYPTGQAFHVLCAAAEVERFGGEARSARARKLLSRLARLEPVPAGSGDDAAAGGDISAASLARRLEEEVGCEDPWNGELLVRMLDTPFGGATDEADDSWGL